MRTRTLATALALAVALPAGAGAHSLVRPSSGIVAYLSADATSLNTLTVRPSGGRIEFRDPTVDGGMDPGSCDPGETTNDANRWIVQTFCPSAGVRTLRLDLGEREDTVTVAIAISATMLGGPGADRLTGGPAADQIAGGEGDDTLAGGAAGDTVDAGLGFDRLDGGDGDDALTSRDGLTDAVRCGAGADRVDADTLDEVARDCESVKRTPTVAPPGADARAGDRVAPRLELDAPRVQRVGRTRRVRVYATSTERGAISASGFLEARGLRIPISTDRRRVTVAGGGVRLTYRLNRRQWRETTRAWRKRRRVTVRLGVVATDVAGNSRQRRAPTIRLRR